MFNAFNVHILLVQFSERDVAWNRGLDVGKYRWIIVILVLLFRRIAVIFCRFSVFFFVLYFGLLRMDTVLVCVCEFF